jgi:threonyl-tRNA synthetase
MQSYLQQNTFNKKKEKIYIGQELKIVHCDAVYSGLHTYHYFARHIFNFRKFVEY